MTIRTHRQSSLAITTLGLFLAGALCTDRLLAQTDPIDASFCYQGAPDFPATCVPMTFNANVQLTNLHPAVVQVSLGCRPVAGTNAAENRGPTVPVVNRGYAGVLSTTVRVPKSRFVEPANRTINMTCRVLFTKSGGQAAANPTAAQPESITDTNWTVVATSSTVSWTQSVTIPNAAQ
jgi:hypothetical protein